VIERIARRHRVLVVDDNAMNSKLVQFVLSARGYDVRTASDADEAVAAVTSFDPELILMDVQLPGIDGLELTRRLKADPATKGIVIVAATAYAMKGDEERVLAAGCDAYISKPINTRTLPSQVFGLLSARHPPGDGVV